MKLSGFVSYLFRFFGEKGVQFAVAVTRVKWFEIADQIIFFGSLISMIMISRSLIAVLILIGFGIWNYWGGLTCDERDRKHAKADQKPNTLGMRQLIDDVKKLQPGSALRFNCSQDKVEFVVLDAADFEFLIERAGMRSSVKGGT